MGAFHGVISLNCHPSENKRMTFYMITTTNVYCFITCDVHPITCVAHPLQAINENNFISNVLQVLHDL
jgi:hypothetical protein